MEQQKKKKTGQSFCGSLPAEAGTTEAKAGGNKGSY